MFEDEPRRAAAAAAAARRGASAELRGETAKRVLVAIPWIAFAIAIMVAGGLFFAAGDDRASGPSACASSSR